MTFNWQATDPATTLFPISNQNGSGGSVPSGVATGTMATTTTIYSNIIDVSRMDNLGLDVDWTGTPTGTFSILVSATGVKFHTLTFSPALAQPAGSAAGMAISINQQPFKYMYLKYVNASGSGVLSVAGEMKDLN